MQKWKIWIFQTDLTLVTRSKSHVRELLTLSQKLVSCGVNTSSAGYECILFVTWPRKTTPLKCHVFLWIRAPHSMSAPCILIIWGKMLHQKRGSYKYVLPMKNWVEWTTTRRQKYVTTWKISQPQKYTFWKEVSKIKKYKPLELKSTLSQVWKLEMSMMLLCILVYLLFDYPHNC